MINPGSVAGQIPPGDDALIRRIQDLERVNREMLPAVMAIVGPQLAAIEGQQATLTAAVTDLASRVTQTATIATFNTGSLPNDSTWHNYGSGIPITIAVPTGKLIVTVGAAEASLNSGANSVTAAATFSISGGVVANGTWTSRAYLATTLVVLTSAPLMLERAFTVTPGTYTVTGQMQAWASGSASASVNFRDPYLTVQVTG